MKPLYLHKLGRIEYFLPDNDRQKAPDYVHAVRGGGNGRLIITSIQVPRKSGFFSRLFQKKPKYQRAAAIIALTAAETDLLIQGLQGT